MICGGVLWARYQKARLSSAACTASPPASTVNNLQSNSVVAARASALWIIN